MTRLFANDIGHEPNLEPPDPEPMPICPICGAETDLFYVDKLNGIVGCPECVLEMDAYRAFDKSCGFEAIERL